MEQPTRFIGMDVHKDTIVVAVTGAGEVGKATAYGTFPNTAAALLLVAGFRWECGDCYDGTEMIRERRAIRCTMQ